MTPLHMNPIIYQFLIIICYTVDYNNQQFE